MTKAKTEAKMVEAVNRFKEDLKGLRTGRANPSMLDMVTVMLYGTQMRIRDLAQVTTPDPRKLLITAFDTSSVAAIEDGIKKANLGFMPQVEGNLIRVNVPPMDATIRDQMVKECHKRKEDAKISVRNVRQAANNEARKQKADGEIAEDVLKKLEKAIQELTDKFCKEIDTIALAKEKEITTI